MSLNIKMLIMQFRTLTVHSISNILMHVLYGYCITALMCFYISYKRTKLYNDRANIFIFFYFLYRYLCKKIVSDFVPKQRIYYSPLTSA
jgi:hypothetical protein